MRGINKSDGRNGDAAHLPEARPSAASNRPPLAMPPTAAHPTAPATQSLRAPVSGPGGSAAHADESVKRSAATRSRGSLACSSTIRAAGLLGAAAASSGRLRALAKASRRAAIVAWRASIAFKTPSNAVCLAAASPEAVDTPSCCVPATAGRPARMRSPCSATAARIEASVRRRLEGSTTSCVPRKSAVFTASRPQVPSVATLREASA